MTTDLLRRGNGLPLILMLLCIFALSACQPRKPIARIPESPPPKSIPETPPTGKGYFVLGKWYYPLSTADGFRQTGTASWYGDPFHGKKTSNGETYDMNARTAAHKTLPMGTFVLVRSMVNSKETIVRINDRGPFVGDRIIDLSFRAAREIEMIAKGTAPVEVVALNPMDVASHPDFYTGDFTVQVGAFSDRTRADAFRQTLLEYDANVSITPITRDGRSLYRVRIGKFSSLKQAEELQTRLNQGGYQGAIAVANDN